jgi:hypothetical protein
MIQHTFCISITGIILLQVGYGLPPPPPLICVGKEVCSVPVLFLDFSVSRSLSGFSLFYFPELIKLNAQFFPPGRLLLS